MNEEMFITEIRTFLESLSFKVSKDKHNDVYKYLLTQTHHKKKGLLPLGHFLIEKKTGSFLVPCLCQSMTI